MLELPELTPEHFEILVMRELRKIGLDVSELRTHRRSMLPEPERGYLLELKGVLRRPDWQRRTLIACRRTAADRIGRRRATEGAPEGSGRRCWRALRRGRFRAGCPDDGRGRCRRAPPCHGWPNRVRHERLGNTGALSRLASRLLRAVREARPAGPATLRVAGKWAGGCNR